MMSKLSLFTLNTFVPEKQYLVKFLERELELSIQLEFHDQESFIFKSENKVIFEFPDIFFANEIEKKGYRDFKLPETLSCGEGRQYIYANNKGVDYFGDIFFCLTRWEEHQKHFKRDEFKRVIPGQLFIFQSGLYKKPHVNEILSLLRKKLTGSDDVNSGKRNYSVILTHDIDQIYKYKTATRWIKLLIGNLIKRKSFKWFLKDSLTGLKRFTGSIDPYQYFGLLNPDSKATNIDQIFFLLRKGEKNSDYDWKELPPYFKNQKLGLHNAVGSVENDDWDAKDLRAIQEIAPNTVIWSRYHFLAHQNYQKGKELIQLGLTNESSRYDSRYPGFSCGICHEFPWYDLEERKITELMIHPISFMDVTKIHLNWSHDEMKTFLRQNVALHQKYGGNFVLLWHNTSFYNWEFDDPKGEKYQEYLDIIISGLDNTN